MAQIHGGPQRSHSWQWTPTTMVQRAFNLTHSSLKGEALHVFNDKAAEQEKETKDTQIKCLCAITEHVFPKDNPLLKQKTYMCNDIFLHLSERQVSEFHARWDEINKYHNEFPPFWPNQCFLDEQTKDILYTIVPKCWQSYLQCDNFDIIGCSIRAFLTWWNVINLQISLILCLNNKTNQKLIKTIPRSPWKSQMTKSAKPSQRKMILMHRHQKVLLDPWTRQFPYDQWMLSNARTSLSNERSLEKHLSGKMLSSETWTQTTKAKREKWRQLHEMIMKEVQQSVQSVLKQSHLHPHLDKNCFQYEWSSPLESNGRHHGERMF